MAALQAEFGEERNSVLQPIFVGRSRDSDRDISVSAEETAHAVSSLPLVIKLLDLVLSFLILVKRQKNASPSSEAVLPVFTIGELVSLQKQNGCCGQIPC